MTHQNIINQIEHYDYNQIKNAYEDPTQQQIEHAIENITNVSVNVLTRLAK